MERDLEQIARDLLGALGFYQRNTDDVGVVRGERHPLGVGVHHAWERVEAEMDALRDALEGEGK